MSAIRLLACFGVALCGLAVPPDRSVPLLFTENRGQASPKARFLAKTQRFNVYFERGAVALGIRGAGLRLEFLDSAAGDPEAVADGGGEANFLIGPEETWVTAVPLLGGVRYRDVYPGVDVYYRGSGPHLKSEYVVRPGQDPARIRLRYEGAEQLAVEPDGSLAIRVGRYTLHESPPVVYQEREGRRVAVEGDFQVNGEVVSFNVGAYDRTLPLTIDPVLYLTLFGGSGADAALSLAVDSAGSAYIAGFTSSFDLPIANPAQNSDAGGNEVFVAKLTPQGNGVVYCTYIGGRGDDRAYGIAVDATGAAYVTGGATSTNFPVKAPIQAKLSGGWDAFVLKLAPAGNALVYSTYLGGAGADTAYSIAVDAAGNAYVAGDTSSLNFPATAFQKLNRGTPDGFVAKLSPDGSRLVYSTYLGGSSEDHLAAIAVDSAGAAVVTGSTYSGDFPVANAYQAANAGGQDAVVAKLSANGQSLVFSTYFGGSSGMLGATESGRGVALDSSGNIYVTGETSSVNFPIRGAAQSTNAGWQDGFVSKFGPSGALIYSTYVGGVNIDLPGGIAVDRNGYAYIAGQTTSVNLASILLSQSAPTGIFDAFVVKFAPAGNTIAAVAYLGGIGADNAAAIAVDAVSNVYIAGWTQSPNFSVVNGIQTINGGNYSAFVGKIDLSGGTVSVGVSPASATLYASQTQQFTATVNASNTAVTWSINPAGVGSISSVGLYTAPASITAQQTVTVKATSVADSSKSAAATLTLYPPVSVSVTPSAASLPASQTQQFSATVANTGNSAVSWSITPAGVGSISNAGLYTAPSSISTQQTVTVKATSVADTGKSATAAVTLVPGSSSAALRFVPVAACRIVDTRNGNGPFGGPRLAGGAVRNFAIPNGGCGVPATARAYSVSVAVIPGAPLGYLTLWPAGQTQPTVATLNSLDGRAKSNAAIIPSGTAGEISVFASNPTDMVLDVNGYFLPASDPAGLAYYPVAPCRVVDTRGAAAPFGGPSLSAGQAREFPAPAACNIPASAAAYALNVTAVPKGALGYVTVWPTGATQPLASALTAPTGVVTAAEAIVPAGTKGAINVMASNSTDLVIDINGYFAAPGTGGLSLYTATPCRVLDTRQSSSSAINGKLDVTLAGGACGLPAADAYVLNATVAPVSALGYLTLWPQGQSQPLVATLNALDGAITSNLALTPAASGVISVFPSNPTHVIVDAFGYFAP